MPQDRAPSQSPATPSHAVVQLYHVINSSEILALPCLYDNLPARESTSPGQDWLPKHTGLQLKATCCKRHSRQRPLGKGLTRVIWRGFNNLTNSASAHDMQMIPTETTTQPQRRQTGPPPASPWAMEAVQPSHYHRVITISDEFIIV
jgi:hypothetical protein